MYKKAIIVIAVLASLFMLGAGDPDGDPDTPDDPEPSVIELKDVDITNYK